MIRSVYTQLRVNKKQKELYGINVPLDIFCTEMSVYWGDKEKMLEYLDYKNIPVDDFTKDKCVDGFCIRDENNGFKSHVWVGKTLGDYNVICHELMHGILNITDARNIMLDDRHGHQEVECYLVGHVMGCVLETKKKDWYVWRGKTKWIKQK